MPFRLRLKSFARTAAWAFALVAGGLCMAAAQEGALRDPARLEAVRAAVEAAADGDVGGLFRAVRAANPGQGAIVSMRELKKAMSEGALKVDTATANALNAKMSAAQKRVKQIILSTRVDAHRAFAREQPHAARTLSADGDVGSWRTSDDLNSDVDWTAFGTDHAATRQFVDDYYNPMLLKALAGETSGLALKDDFDIVVTPEGGERAAGVFETRGGKKLAMTVMTVVTPVDADGGLGAEFRSDIGAELENAATQARLRQLATKLGVYEQMFDAKGRFDFANAGRKPADPERERAWRQFIEAADDEGLLPFDFKLTKTETLAGTCVDMAKHLHHEAIEQLHTLDRKGQIKRIMKYPGRSEWAYGNSHVSGQLVEDYVAMGDERMRRLIRRSAEFHRTKESKGRDAKEALARLIDELAAEYPDSHELGQLALEMVVRQSHLAMQIELDRIAKMDDAGERGRRLQDLIADFAIAADGGALDAYARAQIGALTAFKAASDDPAAFKAMRAARRSLEDLSAPANRSHLERARAFMQETELGRKILDSHEKALALVDRAKTTGAKAVHQIGQIRVEVDVAYERLKDGSQLLQFVETARESWGDYAQQVGGPAKAFVSTADMLGTFVDAIEAVRGAKTDADLAFGLGRLLWDNSSVGGLVNTLYAFAVGGDNEALAKFIMFAMCPEAAVPELVVKIGGFVAREGAQRLFDAQLDALYDASGFAGDPPFAALPQWKDKDPWLIADFAGYGPGAPAVETFLDDLLTPGGYRAAVDMIARKGASDIERGNEAIARTAVVKTVWMTLALGDHLVLKDDGALGEATQRVKLLTDEIVALARHMGKEVARAPENFAMPDGASPGEQAALNKLVKERDAWVAKAKAAMAQAIVRTFEERRRAASDLSDTAMQERLRDLRALLARLSIEEQGLAHLSDEGNYNFLQRNDARKYDFAPFSPSLILDKTIAVSQKEQIRKMVTAINRYHDAYAQVLSLRDALAQLIQVQTGAPPDRQPLTGAPPLCGERAIDQQNAQAFFEKTRTANEETARSLAGLKGQPLAGAFDDRIRRGVNAAIIAMADADMNATIARACRDLLWRVRVFDRQAFTDHAAQSMQRFEEARLKRDALYEEFKAYYAAIKALAARIDIAPRAPMQGDDVQATLRVAAAIPAEAIWRWTLEDDGRAAAAGEGETFRFKAPARGAYVVKAALVVAGVPLKTFAANLAVGARAVVAVSLAPAAPAPGATLAAVARLSPPAGDVDYEWRCDGCAVVSAQGANATLRAPAAGGATARVAVRVGPARSLLAQGAASFSVTPLKPQPGADRAQPAPPSVAPQTLLTPPTPSAPPTAAQGAPSPSAAPSAVQNAPATPPQAAPPAADAAKQPAATPAPDLPLGTWSQALAARDSHRKTGAAERLAAAQARMRALWQDAHDDVIGLPAFVERYIAEFERIYREFRARAPAKPDGAPPKGADGSATLTDLEGETPWSRYACVERMDKDLADGRKALTAYLASARSVERLFATYDDEAGYAPAMQAFDALWRDRTIARSWRTKGVDTSIRNPCDDSGKPASLKIPGAPASTSSPAPAATVQQEPPTVALSLDAANARAGETQVVARAAGGAPPYRYKWTGALRESAERATYATPLAAGAEARARVTLTDARGATASAELALPAPKLVVELTKSAPSGASLPVGAKASFAVRLTADGRPVDAASYVLRWEPSTEARFERAEGAGVVANAATFARPGKTKVWVVALARVGGRLATVGESPQIELDVTGAEIALKVDPAQPRVGQEVRVTATETPAISDRDASWWWEARGRTANAGATADSRVYAFVPRDDRPVTVAAHLKEKTRGAELATKSVTVTAAPYAVSIVNAGPAWDNSTTRPVVWRPGKGLVALDREIAAGRDVALRAEITPAPATAQARYRWTVGQGATVTGNPAARETRVQRASVGPIEARVEVRDANDILLGAGALSVSVTVSDADMATGRAKAAELARLKEDSSRAWVDGEIDIACDKGRAATAIDPAFALAATWCGGRDRIRALAGESEAALSRARADRTQIDRAQTLLDQARAINSRARPLTDLARKIADARAAAASQKQDQIQKSVEATPAESRRQCRDLAMTAIGKQQAGDLNGAVPLYQQSLALCPDLCPVMSNLGIAYNGLGEGAAARKWTSAAVRCDPDNATYKKNDAVVEAANKTRAEADTTTRCRDLASKGIARQQAKDHAGAIALYRQSLALCPKLCPAMNNIGTAHEALGDRAGAKPWFEAAAKCAPDNPVFKKNLAAYQTAAPTAPAPQPTQSRLDGVYIGAIDGQQKSAELKFVVSNGRLSFSWNTDPKKRRFVGEIRPGGDFVVHFRHVEKGAFIEFSETTYTGRIVGDRLSGSWRNRHQFTMGKGEMRERTGTFSGRRAGG